MSIVTVFVGLDYHAQGVQACVLDREGRVLVNRSCANDWREIAGVVPQGAQVFCAIEACTGAADLGTPARLSSCAAKTTGRSAGPAASNRGRSLDSLLAPAPFATTR